MTREDFLDYVAAFNREDAAGYAKHYAPDVTISHRGGELVTRGADAIVARYAEMHRTVRQRLDVCFLVIGEDAVAAELHASFTALEDVPDFLVHPLRKGETVRIHTFVHYDLDAEGRFKAIRSTRYRTLATPGRSAS